MFDAPQHTTTQLERFSQFLLLALTVTTPLIVLPFFTNFMITTKVLFLLVSAVLLLSVFIWNTLRRQAFEMPKSILILPLVLFGVSTLASSLFTTTYPVENLLGMGGIYLAATIIALFGSGTLKKHSAELFSKILTVAGSLVAITTLLQTVGMGPTRILNVFFATELPHSNLFNITGSPFIAVQLLGVLALAHLASYAVTRKLTTFQLVNLPIILVGLIMNILLILPGKEASPLLLPFGVSWSIAVDVMKEPRSALIGVGPENYSSAYMIFRPSWTNTTLWWSNIFGQGANVPLTLLATGGLFALGAWIFLAARALGLARAQYSAHPFISTLVAATFILQLLLPSNVVLLSIQAIALAYIISLTQRGTNTIHILKAAVLEASFPTAKRPGFLFLIPIAIAAAIGGFFLYGIGRAYAASNYFLRSSTALQENNAVLTYDLQRQAIDMNPYLSLYRSNYALTNLAIATALSNKTDITEQETQQVSQLIQQAIREAQAGTQLRPSDSQSWRVLAQIYRDLIGTAEGADQWALSAYVQAINTHPTDPALRVELGGLFLGAQQFPQAASLFQQAAELKPDYANAYYNLANTLKATNDLANARTAYQQTLALLPTDSPDYIQANQELEELEKAIAATGSAEAPVTENNEVEASPTVPSLLDQNINESPGSAVTPASEELSVTPTPTVAPSPTTTP
ncbi:MAG: tetratricopeptide repeat protein [bacterium]|nr:tetratricopeptide repeat protein [bacterium]